MSMVQYVVFQYCIPKMWKTEVQFIEIKHFLPKALVFYGKAFIVKQAGIQSNVHTHTNYSNVPLGCDAMSCTSWGLFCMTSAASLKVMPSRLVWFKEMSRPPVGR